MRNVVSPIVSIWRWQVDRKGVPVDEGVRDAGGSESWAVMAWIGVRDLPCSERRLTSGRSWITRKVRKGLTVGLLKTMGSVASLKARRAYVSRVQTRIVKVSMFVTGCFTAPYQGLSPVQGNLLVGF